MLQTSTIAELKRRLKSGELARAKDAGPANVVQLAAVESINEAERTAIFVMSDPTQDWVGDRLMPEGAKLEAFMRNPQFLWSHQQEQLPIGKWKRVWVQDGKLKGEAYFTPPEIDEPGDPTRSFSERCWSMVKAGLLPAVSVFFVINEDGAEFNGDGLDVTDWTPLECSLVTVGMNQNALMDGKALAAHFKGFAAALEERMAKGTGSKTMSEGNAGDGGNATSNGKPPPPPAPDKKDAEMIANSIKSLQDMHATQAKLMADHAKLVGQHSEIMGKHAKAVTDGDAQSQKIAAIFDDLSDTLRALLGNPDDDDAPEGETDAQKSTRLAGYRAKADELWAKSLELSKTDIAAADKLKVEATELHAKASSATGAKASSAHKLSGEQFKRAKALVKTAGAMLAAHHASGGNVDEGEEPPPKPDPKDEKPKSFEAWFSSLTPAQIKAAANELAAQELRRARGSVD